MTSACTRPNRRLPDGSLLQNRLLAALPTREYERLLKYVRMTTVRVGDTLQASPGRVDDVYFPNGGVFSVTNEMRDGALVEIATVGREGMLGIGVFLGDRAAAGRTFQQVADGRLPAMSAARFLAETAAVGPFRAIVSRYAQAHLLQVMQSTACNALHSVTQRCCRWLLQTHDRVDEDTFALKQEVLAVMLGVQRSTVSIVLRTLQRAGAVSSHYGHIQVVERHSLEAASCECYDVIRAHFARLGL